VIRDTRGVEAIDSLVDLEVRKKSWRFPRENPDDLHRAATNLQLGAFARSELEHRSPRARIPRDDDFCLGRIRENSTRRLARHLPAMDLVSNPGVSLHQRLDESHVAFLRGIHLLLPRRLELRVADNRRRHHEVSLGFVDVPLRELRVRKAGAMPHQLVSKRATHSLEKQRVVRMLENTPVTLLLDVLEILSRRTVRRILLAHIAEPPGKFRESLTIGAFAEPVDREMRRLVERWAREDCDSGLCKDHGKIF